MRGRITAIFEDGDVVIQNELEDNAHSYRIKPNEIAALLLDRHTQ